MGLRTGGRRAKSLKNRVKSSKIELRFREVRSEGRPSRAAVQQALTNQKNTTQKAQNLGKFRFSEVFLYIFTLIDFDEF